VQIAPRATVVDVAVLDAVVDVDVDVSMGVTVAEAEAEEARTPSQDPEIQVLNAQSREVEQVAPVLPQRV